MELFRKRIELIQVSVITPCYNAAAFIAETIESVANQTLPGVEHIIADDGSIDSTREIIERYGSQVRPLYLEHHNAAYARNRGFEIAQGRFLLFLDADDLISPDALEGMITAIEKEDADLAFAPWSDYIFEAGSWNARPPDISPTPADGDYPRAWIRMHWYIPPCAVLWDRKFYERVGPFDETLYANDDRGLMFRAHLLGARLARVARGRAYYRRHPAERTSNSTDYSREEAFRGRVRTVDKFVAWLQETDQFEHYRIDLARAYYDLAVRFVRHQPEGILECEQKAWALAGWDSIEGSLLHRWTSRRLGLWRKERLRDWLASAGLSDHRRNRLFRFTH